MGLLIGISVQTYAVCWQAAEQDLRRQFQEAVKAEEKRYRSQRDDIAKLPKAEQRDTLKKLKQDRSRNISLLSEQFDDALKALLDRQNVSKHTYLLTFSVLLLFNCPMWVVSVVE